MGSTSVADQLNDLFSKGTGVLTRTVRNCWSQPCEMWKLTQSNSFLLMHPYSWSNIDQHYSIFQHGREYGWPGIIAAPNILKSMVTCSWPLDADTKQRNHQPIG